MLNLFSTLGFLLASVLPVLFLGVTVPMSEPQLTVETTTEQGSPEAQIDVGVADVSNQTKIKQLLSKLCAEKDELGLGGYEGAVSGIGGEIFLCGEYIKIYSPLDLMDAPAVIFDLTGKKIAACGGLPKPGKADSAECSLRCEKTDLYFCAK